MKRFLTTALILAISILTNSCNEELFFPEDIRNSITAPEIHSFEPQRGSIGTEIVVSGRSLSSAIRAYIGTAGENPVEIVQRFTDYSLVLRIVGTEMTGPITIVNNIGPTTTTEQFIVDQNIPNITPPLTLEGGGSLSQLVDGQRILITGEQINAIRRVTFGEGDLLEAGRFIDRGDAFLIVEVPYLDISSGILAPINIEYMAFGVLQTPEIARLPVENVFVEPLITNQLPTQVAPNRMVILRGSHLNRVSEVFLSGHIDSTWTIMSQSRNELRVLVPDFTAGTTEGNLTLVHNRALVPEPQTEKVVGFISVVNEGALNFVFYRNVILNVNRYYGGEGADFSGNENFNNFFNADNGQIFSPCDHQVINIADVTTFFFSITGTAIRLNNPSNSGNEFFKFRCSGEQVLEPGLIGTKTTRFRRLNWQTHAGAAELRDRLLGSLIGAETIEGLYLSMLAGTTHAGTNIHVNDTLPTANVLDFRGSSVGVAPADNNWHVGDILMFRELVDDRWGRFGFLHISAVNPGPNFNPENPTSQAPEDRQESSVLVNVWFQREAE